ncbi:rhomboid family intramembrane serine protease [Flavivirga sp. 57AJ16]|uniref:rhomboid family intramembrane serine protease n=1 Tax=Flavivirga sp. 57AJ16 TaxID=3025307 RepID=UPI0023662E4E|nr:rhomboid family intramembrane serine protease [Flavivirga sp. 57AJ16]MDD7886714.1 rhomboid family intramembrane serine protease [Flavivirga sp. 57AJ16]
MMRISETVKHLLIINVIMFIGTLVVGQDLFFDWFAMHFPKSDAFQLWQIITHMFMHGGITHILFNMFALWMFGTPVEQALGSKRFLFIYISAGLGAVALQVAYYYFDFYPLLSNISDLGFSSDIIKSIVNLDIVDYNISGKGYFSQEIFENKLLSLFTDNNLDKSLLNQNSFNSLYEMNVITHNSTMVGASGCIMGILAAFGMMNPNAELMLIFLPIPIKAKYFIPGIIILDLISGLTGQSFFSPSNTAYMAHVGGALIGFLIMWYWKKTQFNRNRWD